MTNRNRVDPWSRIAAAPARGTLFGNRGVLHDDSGTIVRNQSTIRWISCELEFKDRRRPLLRPGRYTGLFFLDEATALAAGHRPCFECRRRDVNLFRAAWMEAYALQRLPSAPEMDTVLDSARRESHGEANAISLPDGVMIESEGIAWMIRGDAAYEWSHDGYVRSLPRRSLGAVGVLTPWPIVKVLVNGYVARLHPSAGGSERA